MYNNKFINIEKKQVFKILNIFFDIILYIIFLINILLLKVDMFQKFIVFCILVKVQLVFYIIDMIVLMINIFKYFYFLRYG